MDRKRVIVAVCMILAAVLIIGLTWKTGPARFANTGGTPGGNQAQVVTQGGTVTLVPGERFPGFTVTANLPATNSQSKTSSPAASPKRN